MQRSLRFPCCPQMSRIQSMITGEFGQATNTNHLCGTNGDEVQRLPDWTPLLRRRFICHGNSLFVFLCSGNRTSFPQFRFALTSDRYFLFMLSRQISTFERKTQSIPMRFCSYRHQRWTICAAGRTIVPFGTRCILLNVFWFQYAKNIITIFMLIDYSGIEIFPSVFFDRLGDFDFSIMAVFVLTPSILGIIGDSNVVPIIDAACQFVHIGHVFYIEMRNTTVPVYEYQCESCQTPFERRLPMDRHTEPESEVCPGCGKENTVKQQFSMFALGDPIRLGFTRPDAGFNEVMDKIKRSHPMSAMARNDRSKYGKTGVV